MSWDDLISDLLEDFGSEGVDPEGFHSLEQMLLFLRTRHACPEALEAAAAWWERQRGAPAEDPVVAEKPAVESRRRDFELLAEEGIVGMVAAPAGWWVMFFDDNGNHAGEESVIAFCGIKREVDATWSEVSIHPVTTNGIVSAGRTHILIDANNREVRCPCPACADLAVVTFSKNRGKGSC
jgi:hypothetical protein